MRVVICEDLALLRDGLKRLLHDNGMEVVAEVDSMLMMLRRHGKSGRPSWLHPEIYGLVRRVARWNQ